MDKTYGWVKILILIGVCLCLCIWLILRYGQGVKIDNIDDEVFRREVLESDVPVLLLFCADWHWSGTREKPPIVPAVKELAIKYEGVIKLYKILKGRDAPIAKAFKIKWTPTLLILKNGRVVWRGEGAGCNKEESMKAIEKQLKRVF
jgi:thioredoxin 1